MGMKVNVMWCAIAFVAYGTGVAGAGTTVLHDNYFGPDNGTANGGPFFGYAPGLFGGPPEFAPVTEIASRFDVSGGNYYLDSVEATMMWMPEALTGNPINDGVIMHVHEDSGGLPGAVLGSYSVTSPAPLAPSNEGPVATEIPFEFDFLGQNILLEDNQSYWFSIETINDGFAIWAAALDPNSDPLDPSTYVVPGTKAQNQDGDGWMLNSPGPGGGAIERMAFRVTSQAVPAPGALALLGLGGFATTRRRRRN